MNKPTYFLAANSCEGFVSKFDSCYNPEKGWKCYIIKGGPGSGKSSFMKKIGEYAQNNSICAEFFPCSSDPDSLDAVTFPDLKIAVMDGTAPHTVDPKYPGVCETILNFGNFWNLELFKNKAKEVINATKENKVYHKSAALYLQVAGRLFRNNYNIAKESLDAEKIGKYADKLCKAYFKEKGRGGSSAHRFLTGITPKGIITFDTTVTDNFKDTVIIEDEYGPAADTLLKAVERKALNMRYEIIVLHDSFLPDLYDHILIPKLSLAFVRENDYITFKSDVRRIHARRFTNMNKLHKNREKLKFNKKACNVFLNSAVKSLKDAKSIHDKLEEYYIQAMNFEKLNDFTIEFCEKVLKNEA